MLGFLGRLSGSRGRVQNNSLVVSKDIAEVLGYDTKTKSGAKVNAKTAMGIAAVNAGVRLLAENVGMLPFPVYKRVEEGGRELKIKDRTHPLWNLLNRQANIQMSSQEFWETSVAHQLLYRHFFALKVILRGQVRELIPIHPHRVWFTEQADMSLAYRILLPGGVTREFTSREIFHLRDFSPEGLSGKARVIECREALGLAQAAENYGAEFFANDGTPSGVLSTKAIITPEAVEKVRQTWSKSKGGTKVVDNDFTFTPITTSAQEAQMLETRKFQVTEVARILRVPPHKLGDLDRATFSNIDAQEIDFQQNSMMPWYRRIESGVTMQLMTPQDQLTHFVKIDNRAMLRGDQKSRAEYYQKMRVSKIMTANECRDLEDMNPIEGGDVLENPAAPMRADANTLEEKTQDAA